MCYLTNQPVQTNAFRELKPSINTKARQDLPHFGYSHNPPFARRIMTLWLLLQLMRFQQLHICQNIFVCPAKCEFITNNTSAPGFQRHSLFPLYTTLALRKPNGQPGLHIHLVIPQEPILTTYLIHRKTNRFLKT